MSGGLSLRDAVGQLAAARRDRAVYQVKGGALESGLSLGPWAGAVSDLSEETGPYRVEGDRVVDAAGTAVVVVVEGKFWAFWDNQPPTLHDWPGSLDEWRSWVCRGEVGR